MTEVAGKPGPEAEVAKPVNLEPTAQEKFARLQGGAIIGIKTAKHFLQNDGAPDFPSRSRQLNQAKVELEEAKPIIDQLGLQVSIINYKWFEELTNGLGDQKGTFIDRVRQIDTAYQASDKLEQIVTNAREDLRRMSGSRQSRIIHYRQIRDIRRQLKQLEVYSEAYGKRVKPYQDKLDSIKTNAILAETARKEAVKTYSQKVLSSTQEKISYVREASARLLTDPQWVDQANEALIAELVEPSLVEYVADGMFDSGVAEEIRGYVRTHLKEGFRYVYKTGYVDPGSPAEHANLIKQKFEQYSSLSERSKFRLEDILRRVGLEGNYSKPSELYRELGDVMTNLALYQSLNSLKDLQDELDPETRSQLDVLLKPFTQAINVHDLFRTKGLSRWRTVAERLVGNGVLSNTDLAAAEGFFIQEAGKVLHYGGRESWDGTYAAWAMAEVGSARALPTLFSHIRMFGSGHTTVSVLGNLERIYRINTPEQIEVAMVKMSPVDKRVVHLLGDPNSFIHQLDNYGACELIKRSSSQVVAKEQIIKLLSDSGLQRGELHNFYFAELDNDPEIRKIWDILLSEKRDEAERVIIESKTPSWARAADKFLAALVNPKNGDPIAFPRRVMTEGLGVTDQKMFDVLNSMFGQKTFNRSGFQREAFLDGLLILNSRTDGARVLDKLFVAYRGSRSDPERITKIFRMMEAMNNLGESEFAIPDSSEVETLSSEVESLDELSKAATTREQRKEYQAQSERLKVKLNDLTGLKGIEDVMTEKFVGIACKRLELPEEYRAIVQQNLEGLYKIGITRYSTFFGRSL